MKKRLHYETDSKYGHNQDKVDPPYPHLTGGLKHNTSRREGIPSAEVKRRYFPHLIAWTYRCKEISTDQPHDNTHQSEPQQKVK